MMKRWISRNADAHRPSLGSDVFSADEGSDFLPDSFVVEIPSEDDLSWVKVKPVYYERDDSTKGNTNPKAQHAIENRPLDSDPSSNLLRQEPASIISLPTKIQQSSYYGRCKHLNRTRIFHKKDLREGGANSEGVNELRRNSSVPDHEPSSPKVSCVRKVLSQREREKCRNKNLEKKDKKNRTHGLGETGAGKGCWRTVVMFLRWCCCGIWCGGTKELMELEDEENYLSIASAGPLQSRAEANEAAGSASMEPPPLVAMQRLTTGQRQAFWVEDVAADDGPLLLEGAAAGVAIGSRRQLVLS